MIEAVEINKIFNNKPIIKNFNINIQKGDFIAIKGESGKGKTTLLNMLGLLEKPSDGDIFIEGLKNPNKKQIMLIQRNLFGYIFQNFGLIENETVASNLAIALEYKKNKKKIEDIRDALAYVNLEGFVNKKIFELSGGEQQRVALARVLLKECSYIFADEPTGNLDIKNRDIVFDILRKFNDMGKTIIFVTHDEALANKAHRCIDL